MNCEVLSKIVLMTLFIATVLLEVYLSHQNGKDSGAASKTLSSRIHISEKMLRTGAHIISFAVMTVLACQVWKIAPVAVVIWSVMDEVTKPMLKNERHCSVKDIGWNVVGCVIGFGVWMATRSL